MAFDKQQFSDLIIWTLKYFDLYSQAAVNLLLGTAAVESDFGTYLRQIGGGPARGIFQMEPPTYGWLAERYSLKYRKQCAQSFPEIEWDLRLAILFARLRYRVDPSPLPAANDVVTLACYWKNIYNTAAGGGTPAKFVSKYNQFCR